MTRICDSGHQSAASRRLPHYPLVVRSAQVPDLPPVGPAAGPPRVSLAPPAASPPLPRGLIFLSSLWLVGSWLVAIGIQPPVQPSSASYTPGVRLLLDCIAAGVTVAWPLLRFSQPACAWPIRRAVLDLIVLAALIQIVVWPMRLVTPWSVARTVGDRCDAGRLGRADRGNRRRWGRCRGARALDRHGGVRDRCGNRSARGADR